MRISGNDAPTVAKDTGHADLRVLLGTYVQRGSDEQQKALTAKFQSDFYDDASDENPVANSSMEGNTLVKLIANLDDANRELLLRALINTSGT
ncbi:MAG: hypothetical protein LBM60_09655 [Clostridium sp.]|jgi:hypothetical protein|nr:hypothetical protein [Clostridium sp.]